MGYRHLFAVRLRFATLRWLGWVIVAALPLAAHSASVAQQEFASVLRAKADVIHGETLFETCAACHRTDAAGADDGTVPAIAAQHFRFIARALIDYRHHERWDERMEHFTDEQHLNGPQDIADLAAYISGLKATRSLRHGSGAQLQRGAKVYARMCTSCHQAMAEGDNRKGYPRLAGQQYEYLLRQLHDEVEGRKPDFPREHIDLIKRFERLDFEGIADYLSRLGP